ncbi:hypothetical protein HER10_EVM0000191 [Colletotrichum scovillei]|uniref:uncharacterized protein n=1 Tax=Colletotrichum scovillei TaxID=1209932 RepID=UPI0015C35DB3|nr:uncharacterized protein HER10_EVM0000191 [Colletotrichum scovillei]KAF4783777.1 hypothetical protein HER10_EVM0000191 [Colletotrichum scovillei]
MPYPFRRAQTLPTLTAQDELENASILRNDADNGHFRGLPASRQSKMKVLGKVLSRWAITMVIIISIYVVIWTYSNKTVMTQTTKRQYNALITGLSIALGLAVASSLNHMVAELRWWILSRRYRSKRKHTIALAARSKRWSIHLAAVGWLILTIGSQVGLAAIGLCYSTDTADKRALLVPGNVSIANMASIETERVVKSKTQALGALQYTANSYGTISLAYDTAEISAAPLARAIHVPSDPLMFCTETVCKYVFYETSTASIKDPDANPVTVATDRSVNSTTKCTAWPVISGGNGNTTNVTVALENNRSWDIFIPNRGGTDQTTFMTYSQFDCGTGCSMIMAFEASDTSPWYYSCNVTIGQVANATRAEHQVGANLTSLASAGIALQGYAASSFVNDTNFQYQMYPSESVFGTPMNGTTSDMEAMLSRFAIGVVAISADSNTNLVVEGDMPMKGTKLNVSHWGMINLILILTASLQLVLGIGVALWANRVVVPDGGAVEMAQVMRTMAIRDRTTSTPSEKGSTGEPRYKSLWIYRDTLVSKEGGLYDLHMEEQRYHATSDSGMIEMSQQRPGTGRESTAPSTPTK